MIYLQISRTAMGGDGDVQKGALDSLLFFVPEEAKVVTEPRRPQNPCSLIRGRDRNPVFSVYPFLYVNTD